MPYAYKQIKDYLKTIPVKIENSIYKNIEELDVTAWVTPEPVSFSERCSGREQKLAIGQKWGELWDCAWFHFTGTVPESAAGKKVVLRIDVSGEACVVDQEGNPVQGLTTFGSQFSAKHGRPDKRVVDVTEKASGGEKIDLWADAGCNDLFGRYVDSGTMKEAYIATCSETMRKLYYDFIFLQEIMDLLLPEKAQHYSIMWTLNEAAKVLHNYTEEEAKKAIEILAPELEKQAGDASLTISAVGHAHIDLAWLWPIRETIRKGARTFSTVLTMMDRYPDYVFGASQPQLYQWMKDYYPGLYKRIKEKIDEGRWEAQGAMWVEADTNVSGGEALVRQVLYGKQFFRREFGKDMKMLWLPDVFGYSGALPQILKKAGVDYFTTIKLSWSKHNTHPHHTFIWEGIDGSRVLTHMPPEGTYNSSAAPRALVAAEKNFLDKGISDRCMIMFGIGDGGGGPGEGHLEMLKREKNMQGLVPVVQEPSLNFFKAIEKDMSRYKTWAGELYLEFHQGTYTTQANNKKYNRKMEIALRELEYACIQSALLSGSQYPKEELTEIWKEVLLYQFHDILPGSSIARVYDESVQRYEILSRRAQQLIQDAYAPWLNEVNTKEMKDPVLITNSLSWEREEWIRIKDQWTKVSVPAMGYTVIDAAVNASQAEALTASNNLLENDILRVTFANDGTIESIYDKVYEKETIAPDTFANQLALYEDPGNAWDFYFVYDDQSPTYFKLASSEARLEGPRAIVENVYKYGKSTLTQEVILTSGSCRIDFCTHVDWQESGKMLRTSFPVNVYAKEATCDIQFGNIKRPTHRNTSWDMAKYEICAHKWVDLSQGDYGVALMNDCKYGHKVSGNIMDINLLRSTKHPGINADKGQHEFVYSLYPHIGNHISGGVVREGYALNIPLSILPMDPIAGSLPSTKSFINVDADNVIVETVKQAEENNDIIIRLYECNGAGVKAKINLNFAFKSIKLVNLMEEETCQAKLDAQNMELEFSPFEIQTLRVSL